MIKSGILGEEKDKEQASILETEMNN